jgi:Enoyl-CoA hydratase/isomerase
MKNVGDSAEEESVRRIVAKYSAQVEFKYPNEDLINDAFGQPNVQGIRKRLISMSSEWSLETLKELDSLNPFVLEVIFEQFKMARSLSLKENLQLDFALAMKQAHFHFKKQGVFWLEQVCKGR